MRCKSYQELSRSLGGNIPNEERPVVCVQGLGFVGAAMAIAVASARDEKGNPCFNVIGVDIPTKAGEDKVRLLNQGRLPFQSTDEKLLAALNESITHGNLICSTDSDVFSLASITVVDVPFDIEEDANGLRSVWGPFRTAVHTLGQTMPPGSLVIIETTVPPGTCERVVGPELAAELRKRKMPTDSILVAHSFERVMPGKDYLDSIINLWRVYAGTTPRAADACESFLTKVINVQSYPLTRLASTTASETAKVLENSYRAVTIAFMEEWGRFAERIGIDLFDVIAAIRKRPTHSNMRQPGFGVGGYCLTKDPLFGEIAAHELFGEKDLQFPFCTEAVAINNAMPLVTLEKARSILGGNLSSKNILLLGVSYREDIGDTRYSPSEVFVTHAQEQGAKVICHDPLIDYWPELKMKIAKILPSVKGIDIAVFAVPHKEYRTLDFRKWLNGAKLTVLDANNVLTPLQAEALKSLDCRLFSIGRGDTL